MVKFKKTKGFTLIELLLIVGSAGVASIGIYVIFSNAQSSYRASQEADRLVNAIYRLERATGATGIFTGINQETFNSLGKFEPSLNMVDVSSPTQDTINFTYTNVDNGVCAKFASKMVNVAGNISVVTNGASIPSYSNPYLFTPSCSNEKNYNDVVVVLKSRINATGLTTVTPTTP